MDLSLLGSGRGRGTGRAENEGGAEIGDRCGSGMNRKSRTECLTRRDKTARLRGVLTGLKGYGVPTTFSRSYHTRKTFCDFSKSRKMLQKTCNL